MKTIEYQKRFYRDWMKNKDLCSTHIVVQETDLQVFTDRPLDKGFLSEKVHLYRRKIEDYISKDRRFLTSLKPIEVELKAPLIVREMAESAKKASVGPMAAVAGTLAEFLGRDLLKKGYKDIIIENGGDIFMVTSKRRKIGIYAGRSKLWNKLCLEIRSKDTPLGICTSSGTVGHSLSFGLADAVVILSKRASLADAVATATANQVRQREDLQEAVDFAKSVKGISGIIIIIKNSLISWGKVKFVT